MVPKLPRHRWPLLPFLPPQQRPGPGRVRRSLWSPPLTVPVQSIERLVIGRVRPQIILWPARVVHARVQIGVVKSLVLVRETEAVPDLVAHGVPPLVLNRRRRPLEETHELVRVQVVLVHLGHARNDKVPHNETLVDPLPARRPVVVVAHLHGPLDRGARRVGLQPLRLEGQHVRVSVHPCRPLPVFDGHGKVLVPVGCERVRNLQPKRFSGFQGGWSPTCQGFVPASTRSSIGAVEGEHVVEFETKIRPVNAVDLLDHTVPNGVQVHVGQICFAPIN
mmetsp:Transcript_21087/g.42222  ORF Transcript_21087/g.42222 Transcript_21087/m.42222 type:complete len:278 (+) Transcript_21087:164-997(+)